MDISKGNGNISVRGGGGDGRAFREGVAVAWLRFKTDTGHGSSSKVGPAFYAPLNKSSEET